jgi:2-polyprenyl-6-methoxyphenol hydroxylase-like FAD-dependent oxidoreductase
VDRAEFPSDTLSTHWIGYDGLVRLSRWGLLGRVAASGCPPTRRRVIERSGVRVAGTIPPRDGMPGGYAPRRTALDWILLEAAIAAGVEFRARFSVSDLEWDDGRVVGVVGTTAGAARNAERARLVIGADGRNSLVARAVGAHVYNVIPSLTCGYYTYWADTALDGLYSWSSSAARRYQIAIPTSDGLVCTLVGWPSAEFHAVRRNLEEAFLSALSLAPEIAERVRCGRRAERFYGTADLANVFRRPYGSGWALVGDAGHPKDPMHARGISDAFRDAELLVDAADAGLSGRKEFIVAMADYEAVRNAAALPIYERLCAQQRFPASSDAEFRFLSAVSEDQAVSDRFLGMRAGTVKQEEFLEAAPEPIRHLFAAAEP